MTVVPPPRVARLLLDGHAARGLPGVQPRAARLQHRENRRRVGRRHHGPDQHALHPIEIEDIGGEHAGEGGHLGTDRHVDDLLPEILEAVDIPVIAAGGIATGADIKRMLNALAYANAGDYLTLPQKDEVLRDATPATATSGRRSRSTATRCSW